MMGAPALPDRGVSKISARGGFWSNPPCTSLRTSMSHWSWKTSIMLKCNVSKVILLNWELRISLRIERVSKSDYECLRSEEIYIRCSTNYEKGQIFIQFEEIDLKFTIIRNFIWHSCSFSCHNIIQCLKWPIYCLICMWCIFE